MATAGALQQLGNTTAFNGQIPAFIPMDNGNGTSEKTTQELSK
jgi:hypothetical protein